MPGAQTIALAPLSDPETAALVGELLGPDPSVGGLAAMIAERAAGNPFFAEEMVRELAERGVLRGQPRRLRLDGRCRRGQRARHRAGHYRRAYRPADPAAKRTLSAAAVIGATFQPGPARNAGH